MARNSQLPVPRSAEVHLDIDGFLPVFGPEDFDLAAVDAEGDGRDGTVGGLVGSCGL